MESARRGFSIKKWMKRHNPISKFTSHIVNLFPESRRQKIPRKCYFGKCCNYETMKLKYYSYRCRSTFTLVISTSHYARYLRIGFLRSHTLIVTRYLVNTSLKNAVAIQLSDLLGFQQVELKPVHSLAGAGHWTQIVKVRGKHITVPQPQSGTLLNWVSPKHVKNRETYLIVIFHYS